MVEPVTTSSKALWIVFLITFFSLLYFNKTSLEKKQVEFIRNEERVKILDEKIEIIEGELKIQNAKSDSLKNVIILNHYEKERIRVKYVKIRDSVITLPLDESMQFFTTNLP